MDSLEVDRRKTMNLSKNNFYWNKLKIIRCILPDGAGFACILILNGDNNVYLGDFPLLFFHSYQNMATMFCSLSISRQFDLLPASKI